MAIVCSQTDLGCTVQHNRLQVSLDLSWIRPIVMNHARMTTDQNFSRTKYNWGAVRLFLLLPAFLLYLGHAAVSAKSHPGAAPEAPGTNIFTATTAISSTPEFGAV